MSRPSYSLLVVVPDNDAINKGLRKSQKGRSQFDPPARLGGVTRRSENDRRIDKSRHEKPNFNSRNLRRGEHGGRFDDFRHGSLRSSPRSPLHEDEDSSSIARKRSLTQRQRRIVGTTNGKPSRKQHERSSRNSERARRESPGVSSLLPSPNPSTRSPPLNRAERRAAAFDHKENPPAGYKALPTMSAEQEDPIRQRSGKYRTLSPENVVVPKNIRQGQRWADSSDRRKGPDSPEGMRAESSDERPRRKSNAPLAIPYTTPASEFLYGHSVVTAALKFSRRRFYKLYLFDGDSAEVRGQDREVRKLALAANVEVTRVGNDWLRLMDKMSQGRPHNGYILEASPLPKLPVTGLQPVLKPQATFGVALNHQSREEAAVNGNSSTVKYGTGYRRYPFLLLLDGIRDPGNMGAIFRSAYFLGVDGILLCTRNSAALSPVTLKAAAGAAESLPILSVDQPGSFIDNCQRNGWKFYAAVSPNSSESEVSTGRPFYSTSTMGIPTQEHACVMMLGSEGEGLRWNMQKKAEYLLGIEAQRAGSGELDSLNVSVAAALLCQAFLRKPVAAEKMRPQLQDKWMDLRERTGGGAAPAGVDMGGVGLAPAAMDRLGVAENEQRLF
ncbi:MAG: hypothetical protein LQ341_002238 [Variospora aurantia]|nr:MAG: hypothetical protein LQ341_002238 [Variospora aurantia]